MYNNTQSITCHILFKAKFYIYNAPNIFLLTIIWNIQRYFANKWCRLKVVNFLVVYKGQFWILKVDTLRVLQTSIYFINI